MSSLSREIVFLILQFLDDEKFKESMHRLEQESGFFFNLKYFEEKVLAGDWDEVEKYLSGFTKVDDNKYSMKIFFDIRKQKYLEALDRHGKANAVEILVKDLKVFSTFSEIYKGITQLLTLDNFRENEQLSEYGDTKSARSSMLVELNKLFRANPLFRDKLAFPTLKASHLRTLINQSLNWQYQLNPSPNPDINTLFTDHTCAPPNGARASPVSVPFAAVPRAASIYTPLGSHGPFPPTAASTNANSLAGRMANAVAASSVPSGGVTAWSSIAIASNQVPGSTDYSNNESEQPMKHLRPGAHPSEENGGDLTPKIIGSKERVSEELPDRPKLWELTEILNPQQCRVVTMPDNTDPTNRIARLLYTNSGVGILALASNGIQRLWKWSCSEQNPSGKATASVVPQHWQPSNGRLMTNDTSDVNLEEAVPCIALSKNDAYVVSACGGKVSLFNMLTFKVMTTSMPPPPASTFLAFHPQDNNIIAIGMEDSTIHIYNVRVDEVKTKLKGHQKRVSGLAFSSSHHILVSSGADAQLCTWNTENWEKKKSITIMPAGKATAGDTRVQFSSDQSRLLVVHETQLSIYDASKIHDASKTEFLHQWIPQGALSAPISYASYSCNSQLIYASSTDGNIGVFNAESLTLRCRIATSAYMSPALATSNPPTHPLVIAAHPLESNQFAVGLSDGAVKVIEPLESDGKWGTPPSSVASNPSEQQ